MYVLLKGDIAGWQMIQILLHFNNSVSLLLKTLEVMHYFNLAASFFNIYKSEMAGKEIRLY